MSEGKITYEELFVARFFDFMLGAKTTEFMLLIFTPCHRYIEQCAKEIGKEELLKVNKKSSIDSDLIIRFTYNEISVVKGKPPYTIIDCRENKRGVELDQFVSKAKKDAKYLQMWLSKAISGSPEEIASKIPQGLFMLSSLYNGQTTNTKTLDIVDTKAEELINYYLGLKLVV